MTIEPDTKDWTWVLRRRCPECGLDTTTIGRDDISPMIQANAAAWEPVLGRPEVRERPAAQTWSPLEYGCHVRDVFRLYLFRLNLMLEQDDPLFPNWDQDQTAIEDRYADQDPLLVTAELLEAAQALATAFTAVGDDQWRRPGRRSDGAEFTVETFARYLIHDPVHHLHDVTSG